MYLEVLECIRGRGDWRISEGKAQVEHGKGPAVRGPCEKDLGIFADHKVNRSQPCDEDFPKLALTALIGE